MAKITSAKDLIMLFLYARGRMGRLREPIRGRTRLMKMVFLFDKEVRREFNLGRVIPDEALPDFAPYDFGPFSDQVFSDLEFLVELGFVRVKPVGDALPEEELEYSYWQAGSTPADETCGFDSEEEFSLTKLGAGFVEQELIGSLTQEQVDVLGEFKARCTASSLRALLRYVYERYPSMTTQSKIRDEILSTRES